MIDLTQFRNDGVIKLWCRIQIKHEPYPEIHCKWFDENNCPLTKEVSLAMMHSEKTQNALLAV